MGFFYHVTVSTSYYADDLSVYCTVSKLVMIVSKRVMIFTGLTEISAPTQVLIVFIVIKWFNDILIYLVCQPWSSKWLLYNLVVQLCFIIFITDVIFASNESFLTCPLKYVSQHRFKGGCLLTCPHKYI